MHIRPTRIRPKLSSIPRAKTEAANYLELHKLALEKMRLENELRRMEDRRLTVQTRLQEIAQQMGVRQAEGAKLEPATPPPVEIKAARGHSAFDMVDMNF